MIIHLCLRASGSEGSSRLEGHSPELAVEPRDYYKKNWILSPYENCRERNEQNNQREFLRCAQDDLTWDTIGKLKKKYK